MVLKVVLSETFEDGENDINVGAAVMVTAPLVAGAGMDVVIFKFVEVAEAE